MSIRCYTGSAPWASKYPGFGATGAVILGTTGVGSSGPGLLYPGTTVADNDKELSFRIITAPAAGSFVYAENGTFTLTGAPNGLYSITFEKFDDQVSVGQATSLVAVGVVVIALAAANCTQPSTCTTGAVTISAPGITLAASNCVQASTCTTGAVTIGPPVVTVSGHTYATAAAYLRRYGLDEASQLLADEQRLLTPDLLQGALTGLWPGSPSGPEMLAATEALQRLQRQLVVSSNFMDGYLRSAAVLPLAPADANAGTLEDCCMALTRFDLADDPDNSTERLDKIAERWRTWLRDVATSKVLLVGTEGVVTPMRGRVRAGKVRSGFDWGSFGSGR